MAAMKPRTGDGPLEVTKEGRGIVMRVPLEGGGRLVVEMTKDATFVAEAERLGFDVSPIDGDSVLKMIARSAATRKDVITRFNELDKK